MLDALQREERPVRVETLGGVFEGHLRVGAAVRTLDDLNVVSRGFVVIHQPRPSNGSREFGGKELVLNRSSILFVSEPPIPLIDSGSRYGLFAKVPVRMRAGSFDLQGFIHSASGGAARNRFNVGTHPFVALTEVLVVGSGTEFVVPFLAVNKRHVVAVQQAAN